ncbi:MAG: glycosyltransferase family 2 protein [Acidimicrobiia bacterium]
MAVPAPSLSIFFPMYNEEENIHPAVAAAESVCRALVEQGELSSYELIVVDDASTDSTGKIADELAAADPHIRVVHHHVNRKLGGSIKTGFAASTGDLILYTDADLPFDMQELAKAVRIQRLYEVDIVSAYRLDRTTEGITRALYTHVYNFLITTMFGVRFRDVNFAFKLCRRAIFDQIELKSEGSFIDAELIIRATRHGYRILQFGVDYFPRIRGASTLASSGVIATILREMWTLRRELESIRPTAVT